MKLSELKNKFMNRYAIRVAAGVLVVALLGTSLTGAAVYADNNKEAETTEATAENTKEKEEKTTGIGSISFEEKEIGKEESVYLLADANGKVYKTIVTNHLINHNKDQEIKDSTTLADVENVKGDETFSQDGDTLTWKAEGNDIFYRGTTDKEAPVTQRVTYYLDDKEIAPAELAGKSGKVTIRFDYTNNTSYEDVKVPFVAVTTLALGDNFSHVEVTNGKVESTGGASVVIGYALPGLKDSLGIEDSNFIEDLNVPEYFEVSADVEDFSLDVAMTIVANAGSMVSLHEGDTSDLDEMVNELVDAMTKLKDGSSDLADGLDQLQNSLSEYAKGMSELNTKSSALVTGANDIHTSTATINSGIKTLDEALNKAMTEAEKKVAKKQAAEAVAKEFANGKTKEVAGQIYAALRYQQTADGKVTDGALYTSLYDGAYSSNAANTVYQEIVRQVLLAAAKQPTDSKLTADQVAKAIRDGFAKGAKAGDQTSTAMYAISEGMTSAQLAELIYAKSGAKDTLFVKTQTTIMEQLSAGRNNTQINTAVESSLNTLATQLAGACEQAATQAAQTAAISGAEGAKKTIASQIEAVQESGYSLVTGAAALEAGTKQMSDQVPALVEGIGKLNEATGKIVDGVDKLDEGSHTLADGMVTFDEQGISKLLSKYEDSIKPMTSHLQKLLDASRSYQTFTGKDEGTNGTVKFIYKLDGIKAE